MNPQVATQVAAQIRRWQIAIHLPTTYLEGQVAGRISRWQARWRPKSVGGSHLRATCHLRLVHLCLDNSWTSYVLPSPFDAVKRGTRKMTAEEGRPTYLSLGIVVLGREGGVPRLLPPMRLARLTIGPFCVFVGRLPDLSALVAKKKTKSL